MLEINKIYNCDCLEGLKQLPEQSVNLVVTSIPYNMRLRIRDGQYTVREKAGTFSCKYEHFSDDLPLLGVKHGVSQTARFPKIGSYAYAGPHEIWHIV